MCSDREFLNLPTMFYAANYAGLNESLVGDEGTYRHKW